jgi:hypothetical protein
MSAPSHFLVLYLSSAALPRKHPGPFLALYWCCFCCNSNILGWISWLPDTFFCLSVGVHCATTVTQTQGRDMLYHAADFQTRDRCLLGDIFSSPSCCESTPPLCRQGETKEELWVCTVQLSRALDIFSGTFMERGAYIKFPL